MGGQANDDGASYLLVPPFCSKLCVRQELVLPVQHLFAGGFGRSHHHGRLTDSRYTAFMLRFFALLSEQIDVLLAEFDSIPRFSCWRHQK